MEFRWLALIALWTLLSGPIFGGANSGAKATVRPAVVKAELVSQGTINVKP